MNVMEMLENRICYEAIEYIREYACREASIRVGKLDIYWFEHVYTPLMKLHNEYENTGLHPKEYVEKAYNIMGYDGRCKLCKDVEQIIDDMVSSGCKCHKGEDN